MTPGSLSSNFVHQIDRWNHQGSIRSFEKKTGSHCYVDKGSLNTFVGACQSIASRWVRSVANKPAATLVQFLYLSQFLSAAEGAPRKKSVATAIRECFTAHRPDQFLVKNELVRCLSEAARDICSGKSPGESSRYNFGAYGERKDPEQEICLQLLQRSAGIPVTISSAHKSPEEIIRDVAERVMDNTRYWENLSTTSEYIIDRYELLGEVDDSILDSADVADWVERHRLELEQEGVRGPSHLDLVHAADNRFKESGEIRDEDTYRRVRHGIDRMDLKPLQDRYYSDLASTISQMLKV